MAQSKLQQHLPVLEKHWKRLKNKPVSLLFEEDPERALNLSAADGDFFLDYSKNRLDQTALNALITLAIDADVGAARDHMFAGKKINTTENRAVLHTALRDFSSDPIWIDGEDIKPKIEEVKGKLTHFARKLRERRYRVSGGAVTDIVNIGIGGSDLGPVMVFNALQPYNDGPRIHFVSNVDGADFHDTVTDLNPATTLFIIASKTFTTSETMANANLARDWLRSRLQTQDVGGHFAALSTNLEATTAFGIDNSRTFGFWDWVGGRYSIWSAIGLSVMIAIGPERFDEFLKGAYRADKHFRHQPFESNIPVLMALIGIWHRNVCNYATHAILPYDNRLLRFPAYLQQMDMESNGKSVQLDGKPVDGQTGPVIWGEPGTNGQHAFFQLIHQGTAVIPCDFILAAQAHEEDQLHQRMLAANCFAQSQALMVGKSIGQVKQELKDKDLSDQEIQKLAPHKVFEGNRPSNTIIYPKLTPEALGMLIAFYEHKVFVQGVIWQVNSFDQWGVELGKELAGGVLSELNRQVKDQDENAQPTDVPNDRDAFDGSTRQLLDRFGQFSKN